MKLDEIKTKSLVTYDSASGVLSYRECVGAKLPPPPTSVGMQQKPIEEIQIDKCNGIKTLYGLPQVEADVSGVTPCDVTVTNCASLLTIGEQTRLKVDRLKITHCANLKNLAGLERARFISLKALPSFERIGTSLDILELMIDDCDNFVSFKSLVEDKLWVVELFFDTHKDTPKDILNILLIHGLKKAELLSWSPRATNYEQAIDILVTYLPNSKGMKTVRECQAALVDAGLEEYAKL